MLLGLAGGAAPVVLLALMAGGISALALAFVAPLARLRAGWPYTALAVLLAVGVAWLVVYAAEGDTHYGETGTRFDHAQDLGGVAVALVIGGGLLAAVAAIALVATARSAAGSGRRIVTPLLAASGCGALLVAWLALTIGY